MNTKITEILATLHGHGPSFYGSDDEQAMDIAKEWAEEFTVAEAGTWMSVGFWCPSTAASVRDLGIRPEQVATLCENITGDPIYSMCNGDLNINALIEE